ncbi:MAG TPA: TIGR03000 domain-containing protein [Lacipirellulaceae bacterium]|jgi:uncharacterized protein (TIGR03000 family)|nr:TIGR03000 domain-containing protein [Lacipirellulaceae bacterium]
MRSNFQRAFVVVVFAVLAAASTLAWADHGHGGHGYSGGHYSGGHMSYGHYGGHGEFYNNYGGRGFYYGGGRSYRSWPYSYYYRPYAYRYFSYPYVYGYYGYPYGYNAYPNYYYYNSYPPDYYTNDDESFSGNVNVYANAAPPSEYSVSRPVNDIARLEVRLPDPQATIWVEGKEIASNGTMRHFNSPPLDPNRQFTYNIKASWNDNGKVVTDERRVKVQANGLAVVDFTQRNQAANGGQLPPDLPPPQQQL